MPSLLISPRVSPPDLSSVSSPNFSTRASRFPILPFSPSFRSCASRNSWGMEASALSMAADAFSSSTSDFGSSPSAPISSARAARGSAWSAASNVGPVDSTGLEESSSMAVRPDVSASFLPSARAYAAGHLTTEVRAFAAVLSNAGGLHSRAPTTFRPGLSASCWSSFSSSFFLSTERPNVG